MVTLGATVVTDAICEGMHTLLSANVTNAFLKVMAAIVATEGTFCSIENMLTFAAAYCTNSVLVGVLNRSTTAVTHTVGCVGCMLAHSSCVAQYQGFVSVINKGKGNLSALGNKQFVAVFNESGIVKDCKAHIITLISVCHIPLVITTGLNSNVAVLAEGNNEFAILELILAEVFSILFHTVVGTIDKSAQIICRLFL